MHHAKIQEPEVLSRPFERLVTMLVRGEFLFPQHFLGFANLLLRPTLHHLENPFIDHGRHFAGHVLSIPKGRATEAHLLTGSEECWSRSAPRRFEPRHNG
jgi:hypothetical protein